MGKQITLKNQTITYTLKKSWRARRMRLSVAPGGTVAITIPSWLHEGMAERFIKDKAGWVLARLALYKNAPPAPRRTRADYLKNKELARAVIEKKAQHFASILGVEYNRISIRNQKTCWGSCSRKKNLNFNYKILYLPERTQDYIIVHELCHLKEFNHSKKFWALVGGIVPEYLELRRELRKHNIGLN